MLYDVLPIPSSLLQHMPLYPSLVQCTVQANQLLHVLNWRRESTSLLASVSFRATAKTFKYSTTSEAGLAPASIRENLKALGEKPWSLGTAAVIIHCRCSSYSLKDVPVQHGIQLGPAYLVVRQCSCMNYFSASAEMLHEMLKHVPPLPAASSHWLR